MCVYATGTVEWREVYCAIKVFVSIKIFREISSEKLARIFDSRFLDASFRIIVDVYDIWIPKRLSIYSFSVG